MTPATNGKRTAGRASSRDDCRDIFGGAYVNNTRWLGRLLLLCPKELFERTPICNSRILFEIRHIIASHFDRKCVGEMDTLHVLGYLLRFLVSHYNVRRHGRIRSLLLLLYCCSVKRLWHRAMVRLLIVACFCVRKRKVRYGQVPIRVVAR